MFYKEEDISNELICPKCRNRFDDPRILPCGNSLCQSCILDEIDNENKTMNKCYCCQEKHSLPKEGEFIQNKFILKQLEKKPIIIERGALGEQLKKKMIELGQKREDLETYMKSRDQVVSDYLSEIRTQIDIVTETQIERLNKARESLLDKLQQYQTQCMSSKLTNQEDFLAKIDDFNKKIMKYLNGITWKEAYINDQLNEADKLIDLCSKARTNIEKEIFLNKKPIFNSSVTTLNDNETIGRLLFKDLNFNQDNINSNNELRKPLLIVAKNDIDNRLYWLKNYPNLCYSSRKIPKKCIYFNQIHLLSDQTTYLSLQTRKKLSDSIVLFNENIDNVESPFRNYNNHFLLNAEFHVDNLFLICCDSKWNLYMLLCHYKNGQLSMANDSYQLLKDFYNMAANGTHFYSFHSSLVFSYEYQTDKILNRQKLSYKIPTAENARRIKVDSKYFYILNDLKQTRNTRFIYIYDIIHGGLMGIISEDYIDICLIEDGLLACLCPNLVVDFYEVNEKYVTKKESISLKNLQHLQNLDLKFISFSINYLILFDKIQSQIYSYRKDKRNPCVTQ